MKVLVAEPGTPIGGPGWVDVTGSFHHGPKMRPDGTTKVTYVPEDARKDNKRPWHKHTLPHRKGKR